MSPLDLRIAYKRATGDYPTKGADLKGYFGNFQTRNSYKGTPTRDYVIWLEAKAWFLGNKARWYYKRNTGIDPTFYDKKLHLINFKRDYKFWLEEIVCEGYTKDRIRL